jgi:penicillin-binding protein 1A
VNKYCGGNVQLSQILFTFVSFSNGSLEPLCPETTFRIRDMESLRAWLKIAEIALNPLWTSLRGVFVWPITWRVIIGYLTVGMVGVALCLALLISFVVKGAFGPIPSKKELKQIRNSTASEIYTTDGAMIGRYFFLNRVNADISELNDATMNALIATEDARFMKHGGIDLRALFRVLFRSIIMNDDSAGGGSTISQQLAKNLYPRQRYRVATMLLNKIREMVIARKIESIYSKKETLSLYLNTVPFSDNVYGIKVASQRFFNKEPKDLKTEEAALLIGTLKGNTSYHPVKYPEKSRERRNLVLARMHQFGYLNDAELDTLSELPLKLDYTVDTHSAGLAPYFREHLRLELENVLKDYTKPNGQPYNHYTDGLRIYTTLDANLQKYAEQAMQAHMPKLQRRFYGEWGGKDPWENDENLKKILEASPTYQAWKKLGYSHQGILKRLGKPYNMPLFSWGGQIERNYSQLDSIKYYLKMLNTGILAADPETGAIKAWVGGYDHRFIKYDHVKARRQVGSTFKPLLYAQAVESGMDPCQHFPNRLKTYPEYEDWQPKNSDNRYGGGYSLEGALTKSVNTVSVQIIMETGINPVRDLANKMGITQKIPYAPSIALGTVETSLYDMVQAYSCFVNRGVKKKLYFIERIETADGEVIAEFGPGKKKEADQRVMSEKTADIMVKMMRSVVDRGTASSVKWRYAITNDFAGKTGTTQNQSDGWFMGLTKKLVAGVWVGAESPILHFKSLDSGQGSATALPIWGEFMSRVYKDPRYSGWKDEKMAVLPDSVLNRLSCPQRIWYPSDSLAYDSLGNPILPSVGDSTQQVIETTNGELGSLPNQPKRREQVPIKERLALNTNDNRRSKSKI